MNDTVSQEDDHRVGRRKFDSLALRVTTLEREMHAVTKDQCQIEADIRAIKALVRELRERV